MSLNLPVSGAHSIGSTGTLYEPVRTRPPMPIYEYRASNIAQSCSHCESGFEVLAKISDAELSACPVCASPVVRVISKVSVVGGNAHLLKENHFASRGFTQYKKVGGGVYEKTAGDGPRYISDDGK